MARTALLALLFLAGVAACSATPGIRWFRFSNSAGDDPEPSCLTYTDQDSCLDHACGWCSSSVLGDLGCLSEPLAKLVPQSLADCVINDEPADDDDDDDDVKLDKKRKPAPKPPTSCGDNKDKHDCLKLGAEEGECAWCEGDFMPASCLSTMAAKYLPEQVAKCKMPKKHKDDDDDDDDDVELKADKPDEHKPKPPTSCGDNKEKRDCLDIGAEEGDCAWCKGDFMPASCVGVKAAEYIPEQVAKCKMPKQHKGADLATPLTKKHSKQGGGDYPSGGGDYPSGGGDYPSGGGDYPGGGGYGPGGGGQGQGCMALKTKKKCLKGTDTEACAWCGKSSFFGSPCVSESTTKYIPPSFAKCKAGKGPKKSDKVAVA